MRLDVLWTFALTICFASGSFKTRCERAKNNGGSCKIEKKCEKGRSVTVYTVRYAQGGGFKGTSRRGKCGANSNSLEARCDRAKTTGGSCEVSRECRDGLFVTIFIIRNAAGKGIRGTRQSRDKCEGEIEPIGGEKKAPAPTPSPECEDKETDCGSYAANACKKYKQWMEGNCCKTCKERAKKPKEKEIDTTGEKKGWEGCFKSANYYRQLHISTPDLVWDSVLAKKAKAYAKVLLDKCIKKDKLMIEHDFVAQAKDMTGENLYAGMMYDEVPGVEALCARANMKWHREIKDYDYNTCSGSKVGHFTQMVWRGSKKVGLGVATGAPDKNGKRYTIVVARYFPPGNVAMKGMKVKYYTDNVKPLKENTKLEIVNDVIAEEKVQ